MSAASVQRDAIAAALNGAEAEIYSHVPDRAVLPGVVIQPDSQWVNYAEPMTSGPTYHGGVWRWRIRLMVQPQPDADATVAVEDLLDDVLGRLEGVAGLFIETVNAPASGMIAEVHALVVDVIVKVWP